jgi:anti-sigma factor RsiW
MNEHETVRDLLALAAAGVLDPKDQSRLERHIRECSACQREMETLKAYASGLHRMPQPEVPAYLAERTQILVLREAEKRAERRRNGLVLGVLSLLGWSFSLALWFLLRLSMGGAIVVMHTNVLRLDLWALIWSLLVWASGATAAVVLARRRRERRTAL